MIQFRFVVRKSPSGAHWLLRLCVVDDIFLVEQVSRLSLCFFLTLPWLPCETRFTTRFTTGAPHEFSVLENFRDSVVSNNLY